MSLFDVNAPFLGPDGSPIPDMTMGKIASQILFTQDRKDTEADGQSRYEAAEFAMELIAATAPIELTTKQYTMLRDHVGRKGTPLAVKRLWDVLDGGKK